MHRINCPRIPSESIAQQTDGFAAKKQCRTPFPEKGTALLCKMVFGICEASFRLMPYIATPHKVRLATGVCIIRGSSRNKKPMRNAPVFSGGDGGIRTHGAFYRSNDFESFSL